MKNSAIVILALLAVLLMSPVAFAMGGPAVEVQEKTTAEAKQEVQQPASGEALPADLESAKTELTTLEAQREKTENYLEILNRKIINAKMAKDTKKISELQAAERIMADRNNKIVKRISSIRQKYPELQPAGKAGEATGEAYMKEEKPAGSNIVYHEVEMGDTLVGISRKYFGTPIYYREIARMNNIADIGSISQGTRLMIDLNMASGSAGTVTAQKAAPKPAAGGIVYHVVMPGDTLMGISRKYFNGSASYYREIAEMNGITGTGLKVGMKLKIDTSLAKTPKTPGM